MKGHVNIVEGAMSDSPDAQWLFYVLIAYFIQIRLFDIKCGAFVALAVNLYDKLSCSPLYPVIKPTLLFELSFSTPLSMISVLMTIISRFHQ